MMSTTEWTACVQLRFVNRPSVVNQAGHVVKRGGLILQQRYSRCHTYGKKGDQDYKIDFEWRDVPVETEGDETNQLVG
jgi:hypothetical protein